MVLSHGRLLEKTQLLELCKYIQSIITTVMMIMIILGLVQIQEVIRVSTAVGVCQAVVPPGLVDREHIELVARKMGKKQKKQNFDTVITLLQVMTKFMVP